MKGTFKDGLTATDLKAMGIKLSPTQFDNSLHFDISVTGDRVEVMQRQEIFFNVVNFNLKAAGLSFIPRLEYAELCNPMYAIQKKMKPADFKVRVFGSVRENHTAVINWQLENVRADIKKIWKSIVSQIQMVRAMNDVIPDADKIMGAFKVKGVSQDYSGTRVLLGGEFAGIHPSIANMTNVREFAQMQNGDIVMYFNGKYATFTLTNGAKVTFVLENPATGMKSEKEDLYKGIFFRILTTRRRCRYFRIFQIFLF